MDGQGLLLLIGLKFLIIMTSLFFGCSRCNSNHHMISHVINNEQNNAVASYNTVIAFMWIMAGNKELNWSGPWIFCTWLYNHFNTCCFHHSWITDLEDRCIKSRLDSSVTTKQRQTQLKIFSWDSTRIHPYKLSVYILHVRSCGIIIGRISDYSISGLGVHFLPDWNGTEIYSGGSPWLYSRTSLYYLVCIRSNHLLDVSAH